MSERAFEGGARPPRQGMGRSTAMLIGITVLFGTLFLITAIVVGTWLVNRGGDVKEGSFTFAFD